MWLSESHPICAKSVSIALSFSWDAKFSTAIKCKKLFFLQHFFFFLNFHCTIFMHKSKTDIQSGLMETQLVPPWRGDIGVGVYQNAESSLSVDTCQRRRSDGKLHGTTAQRGWGGIIVTVMGEAKKAAHSEVFSLGQLTQWRREGSRAEQSGWRHLSAVWEKKRFFPLRTSRHFLCK